VAVIIGGSGFLCSTLLTALSDAGAKIMILDIEPPTNQHHTAFPFFKCDISGKKELQNSHDKIIEEYGRVDILLNGAGTNAPTPFFDISEDEIQKIIQVNLTSLFFSCQVFGATMVKQQQGSIINFASASSGPPLSRAFVYSVAKAGVINLTQNLAREWAPYKVRVNALRPGFFPTPWSMEHFIDQNRQTKILNHTPMGRFGTPEELIGATIWLASDSASFVTGSVVTVDGGFSAMTI